MGLSCQSCLAHLTIICPFFTQVMRLAVVCKDGQLHLFEHFLNGWGVLAVFYFLFSCIFHLQHHNEFCLMMHTLKYCTYSSHLNGCLQSLQEAVDAFVYGADVWHERHPNANPAAGSCPASRYADADVGLWEPLTARHGESGERTHRCRCTPRTSLSCYGLWDGCTSI